MVTSQSKKRLLWLFGLALFLFSAWGHILPAKEKKKQAAASGPTFQVSVNLVSVKVNVTDKRGLPIAHLTEKDFQILDNGVSQKISMFRVEAIPGSVVSAPNAGPTSPKPLAPATASRKVILFVDDYHSSFEDLVYVKKAGKQFIETGLAPTDLVALITASERFSTEFTEHREDVISTLSQVVPVLPEGGPVVFGSYLMEQDKTKRTFSSLQMLTRRLQAINGPKELILLSPGFFYTTFDDLQKAIDYAIRADTVIDSVNITGFVPDFSAASTKPPGNSGGIRFAMEDPLSTLATETGGKFYHNSNDLFALMQAAIGRSSVNYILGFYPSDEHYDGQFHNLVVKVDRPGVTLSNRKGYFAPKGEQSIVATNSVTIRSVLDNSEELKDVPMALSFNITHEETPESLVEVRTRIDVKKIHFRNEQKRNQNTLTIVVIVYDSNNQFVDGREAHLDLNLTDQHYQDVLKTGLVWQAQFKLSSGHYMVKTAVLEAGESKMGSAFKTLDIRE